MSTHRPFHYRPLAGPIRQFCRERGISQNELAERMDPPTQRSHLSRVLNEQVPATWEYLHRIAVALGVPDDAVMRAEPNGEAEVTA